MTITISNIIFENNDSIVITTNKISASSSEGLPIWTLNGKSISDPLSIEISSCETVCQLSDGTTGVKISYNPLLWRKINTNPSPPMRSRASYFVLNEIAYIFGGQTTSSSTSATNDTWSFNGNSWTQVQPSSMPPPLSNSTSFVLNDEAYIFGGSNGTDHFNDLWKFNGSTWMQVPASNPPPPREGAASFVLEGKVYILGGVNENNSNQQYHSDLWEFDGSQWTQLNIPLPTNINYFSGGEGLAAFVLNGIAYIFGGMFFNSSQDLFWSFDGTAFTELPINNTFLSSIVFEARFLRSGIYSGLFIQDDKAYIFGGGSSNSNFLFSFDGSQWNTVSINLPRPPERTGSAAFVIKNTPYIFGGSDNSGTMSDLWALEPNLSSFFNWSHPSTFGSSPTLKTDSTAFVIDDKGYVFGGRTTGTQLFNELHQYNPSNNTWTLLNATSPSGAVALSTAFSIGEKGYIFGGVGSGPNFQRSNTILEFDSLTNSFLELTPSGTAPTPRALSSSFSINNKGYVFGGFNSASQDLNDLFEFDPGANSWIPLSPTGTPPSVRNGATGFAFDGKGYIFGGTSSGVLKNDLFSYDPTTNAWTTVNQSGSIPDPRLLMAVFIINDKIYFFGGGRAGVSRFFNDLYEFNPITGAWTPLSSLGNIPPPQGQMTYFAANNKAYIFGGITIFLNGSGAGALFDLYELQISSLVLISGQTFYVRKDTSPNITIGSIASQSKSSQQQITFTLLTNSEFFKVLSNGEIRLKASLKNITTLENELSVSVSNDQDTAEEFITVIVIETIESQTFNVDPNIGTGEAFGQIFIDNPENFNFEIVSQNPNNPQFQIINQRDLALLSGTLLSTQQYTITVRAIHQANQTYDDADIHIAVQPGPFKLFDNQVFTINALDATSGKILGNISYDNSKGGIIEFEAEIAVFQDTVALDHSPFNLSTDGTITISNQQIEPGVYIFSATAFIKTQPAESSTTDITVFVLNNKPLLQNQEFHIDTAFGKNREIGTIFASDPDGFSITSITIESIAKDSTPVSSPPFAIESFNKLVTTSTSLTAGTFIVTIRATDQHDSFTDAQIIINVTNNNPPVIDPNQQFFINKGAGPGTFVGFIGATDPDKSAVTFEKTEPNSFFNVSSSGKISVAQTITFDEAQTISIVATDSTGAASEEIEVTININAIIKDQIFHVYHNLAPGRIFGAVSLEGDIAAFTFAITQTFNDPVFSINQTTGRLSYISGNLNTANSYMITVTATSQGINHTANIEILVQSVKSPPVITPGQVFTTTISSQHTTVEGAVGTIAYSNPDGDNITFTSASILTKPEGSSSTFSLTQSGAITVADPEPGTYTFIATAEARANSTTMIEELTETITVIILNAGPQIQNQIFNMDKNIGKNQTIGALFVSDPDGHNITLALVEDLTTNAITDNFEIVGSELRTSSNAPDKFDLSLNPIKIEFSANDGFVDPLPTAMITINIIDPNKTPILHFNQNFYAKRNLKAGSFIGFIGATDPENDEITFTATNAFFDINSETGAITVADSITTMPPLNSAPFDQPIKIAVTVMDTDGHSSEAEITINIIETIASQNFNVDPNIGNGISFGTLMVDEPAHHTFEILPQNTLDPQFTFIQGSSSAPPEIAKASGTLIKGAQYTITVRATNTITNTHDDAAIHISVKEGPFIIPEGQVFTVTTHHQDVGSVAFNEPTGETVTFTPITTGQILMNEKGTLTINPPAIPEKYTLNVMASNGTQNVTQIVTVNILNQAPQMQDQIFKIDTAFGGDKIVGFLAASDADGDKITFSIESASDDPNSNFILDENSSNILKTVPKPQLIAETVILDVTATDMQNGAASSAKVTIEIAQAQTLPVVKSTVPLWAAIGVIGAILIVAFVIGMVAFVRASQKLKTVDEPAKPPPPKPKPPPPPPRPEPPPPPPPYEFKL
ncbi:MAG: hypothetical protein H6850_00060 [Alphaproteobacteria bacterium]|nr:MAG: hypothetical protein H6850_00060 [Alphaproteobacteria bacterium]